MMVDKLLEIPGVKEAIQPVIVQMEPEAIYHLLFGFASLMASKTEPSEVKELASIVAVLAAILYDSASLVEKGGMKA